LIQRSANRRAQRCHLFVTDVSKNRDDCFGAIENFGVPTEMEIVSV
jgi:hypothetical protein